MEEYGGSSITIVGSPSIWYVVPTPSNTPPSSPPDISLTTRDIEVTTTSTDGITFYSVTTDDVYLYSGTTGGGYFYTAMSSSTVEEILDLDEVEQFP